MSNPNKGDVEVEAGGKTYTLRFSIDALCQLEAKAGKSFQKIGDDLASGQVSLTLARQLLWAGLREHHSEITEKMAGELMPLMGGLTGCVPKIVEGLNFAFPEIAGETPNPQKPGQDGTGSAS